MHGNADAGLSTGVFMHTYSKGGLARCYSHSSKFLKESENQSGTATWHRKFQSLNRARLMHNGILASGAPYRTGAFNVVDH